MVIRVGWEAMTPDDVLAIAEAEKLLNRTLAYQAAMAVHEMKERLNVDVAELHLTVAPEAIDKPGSYRVTCTIASLAVHLPLVVEVVVHAEEAIAALHAERTTAPSRGRVA
jgi:hypothetical protein